MPWLRPMVSVYLCSNARVFSAASTASKIGQQQVRRLGQLHRQAGVQHVGTGHALMHEAAVGTNRLRQPGQEGDHVVASLPLDRIDALDVRCVDGGQPGTALVADGAGGGFGDRADAGHAFGRQRLDLEPDAVAVLGRPDGGHLGSGVSRNHRCLVRSPDRGPAKPLLALAQACRGPGLMDSAMRRRTWSRSPRS